MCLILFAFHAHPEYKLVIAANRDEFYMRSTAPAHYWEDHPEILAGRDMEKMGTWMGVNKDGRFSALTNYRNPKEITVGKRSRGELVAGALKYTGHIKDFMLETAKNNDWYPGYNLLAGDINDLFYYSNVERRLQKLKPGIYGVSNHLLNTDWPKVRKGRIELAKVLKGKQEEMLKNLMGLLQEESPFSDELLPNTGVSLEMERMLSPLFIKSHNYGTRSSTVLLASDSEMTYVERTFSQTGIRDQQFTIKL